MNTTASRTGLTMANESVGTKALPGGMSLLNMMIPHKLDNEAYSKASNANLSPDMLDRSTPFFFETRSAQQLTAFAANEAPLQDKDTDCRSDIEKKRNAGKK